MTATSGAAQDTALDAVIDALTFGAALREKPGSGENPPDPVAFKRILVALDDSEASQHALAWSQALAKLFGARVWAATILDPKNGYDYFAERAAEWPEFDAMQNREEATRRRLVDGAVAEFKRASIAAEGIVALGPPALELVRLAKAKRADLIIMGSHGRGRLGRLFLGSVCDAVKNHVSASILIAKNPPPPTRLLIATDGSRASKHAARLGQRMAQGWNAHGVLFHAVSPPGIDLPQERLRTHRASIEAATMPANLDVAVEVGLPAELIVKAAREAGAGLIVMGSRGLTGWKSLVAGSVSNRVAHATPASILLVKDFNVSRASRRPVPPAPAKAGTRRDGTTPPDSSRVRVFDRSMLQ